MNKVPRLQCRSFFARSIRIDSRSLTSPFVATRGNHHETFIHQNKRLFHSTRYLNSSESNKKIVPFNLPDIGEGIAEVEVLSWHVKIGDTVSQFQKIVDVQSDKASVEITSRFDGVVRALHYQVGDVAKTGKPLIDIEVTEDSVDVNESPAPSPATKVPAEKAVVADEMKVTDSFHSLATPAVRSIAKQHQVDIRNIRGSGKDGRVMKEDILAYISKNEDVNVVVSESAHEKSESPISATIPTAPISSIPSKDIKIPIRGLQRAMVKSMSSAWTVPHLGLNDEIIVDELIQIRSMLKQRFEQSGLKLTYLPLIIKATSLALLKHPNLNASISSDNNDVIVRGSHNIGIAMDTPRGLIVPNIKNVQTLSLLQITQELFRLQTLASQGKLGEFDLSHGTFTLSNIGTIGGTYASPILFLPQVAIGAIGRIVKMPRYASTLPSGTALKSNEVDAIVPAHVMSISWSADHRVVDGASIARFSSTWKHYLEKPGALVAELLAT
jgi:2-oxoisovalerate dehydrogenase E2 component (dihydrolipoyl transacylase)